ncbi:hypothetical protein DFH06DRAFT_1348182 [Mycena polygramma]|nr:hypothetical protein DFH06DRAFT_1348182 [Mycena polygramma]
MRVSDDLVRRGGRTRSPLAPLPTVALVARGAVHATHAGPCHFGTTLWSLKLLQFMTDFEVPKIVLVAILEAQL